MLLETLTNVENSATIRTAAASQFKNVIRARYEIGAEGKTSEKYLEVKEEERAMLRENILGALVTDLLPVRNMLEDALGVMVVEDYPERWDSLPGLIMSVLEGGASGAESGTTTATIMAALIALRAVLKRFDTSEATKGDRKSMVSIADAAFPVLKSLLEYLLENDSEEAQSVTAMLLKVVWDGTLYGLPTSWTDMSAESVATFEGWMNLLIRVFHTPVPHAAEMRAQSPSQWKRMPWYQCKMTTVHYWIRLTTRFLRSSAMRDSDSADFAKYFRESWPLQFLNQAFSSLQALQDGSLILPPRVISPLLDFLHTALSLSALWVHIKPHAWDIIRGLFIPLLSFNDDDSYSFEFEPELYLAIQLEPLHDDHNPRNPAIEFIYDLVKHREQIWLDEMILFLSNDIFIPFSQSPPWPQLADDAIHDTSSIDYTQCERYPFAVSKYAGFSILSALSGLLNEEPNYFDAIEDIIATHVIPDMLSGPAWLRAKACSVFQRYARMPFSDPNTLVNGLTSVLQNVLGAEALPLVAEAAIGLFSLIPREEARPIIGPLVPQLLEKLFSLMNVLDNDAVINTLQHLMRHFPKVMRKGAISIFKHLSASFFRANTTANSDPAFGDDTEADFALMAAMSSLKTMKTVYKAIRNSPAIYPVLEPSLLPIIDIGLDKDTSGSSYIEDILDLVREVTTYAPTPFSQDLWNHSFIALANAFLDWAPDYMREMLPVFSNFITKDKASFLAEGAPYLGIVCQCATKYFNQPNFPELDLLPLCLLFEVIILEYIGVEQINQIYEPLITLVVTRLWNEVREPSDAMKVVLLEVILNCLYANTELTVHILKTNGWDAEVVKLIFDLIVTDAFERYNDKKIASLGIASLIRLPMAQQPAYVQEKFLEIVSTWMQLTQSGEEQRISEEAEVEEEGEFEEFDEDEDEDAPGSDADEAGAGDFEFSDFDENDNAVLYDSDFDDDGENIDDADMQEAYNAFRAQMTAEELGDDDTVLAGASNGPKDDNEDIPDGYEGIGSKEQINDRVFQYLHGRGESNRWTLTGQIENYGLSTEEVNEIVFLAQTFEGLEPHVTEQLMASLPQPMAELHQHLIEVAGDKAERMAFEAEKKARKAAKAQELREYYQSLKEQQ